MKLTSEQELFINALLVAEVKSFRVDNVNGVMTVSVKGPIDVATFMENVTGQDPIEIVFANKSERGLD